MKRVGVAAALSLATVSLFARAADAPIVWSAATSSPHPLVIAANDAPEYAACGRPDAALVAVANRAAAHQAESGGLPNADETSFALRAAGDPHPWPRAIGIAGAIDKTSFAERLRTWASGVPALGTRRCGIGSARVGAQTAVTAIVVDAIADLTTPLPTRARVGQWITLEARMLVPTTEVKVVLLGPRGAPKTVVASLDESGRVRSTFSVDQPGPWLAQVLSTVATGPRAALEATIWAGVEPPDRFVASVAPGEDEVKAGGDEASAMLRMINAARASEGLGAVRRDPGLDKVAALHAEAMKRAGLVGHDVGDGDVAARVRAAGLSTGRVVGENVANAPTLDRAHRALWSSPSHRANLLYARYRSVGIGVVRDNGVAWITEVFRD